MLYSLCSVLSKVIILLMLEVNATVPLPWEPTSLLWRYPEQYTLTMILSFINMAVVRSTDLAANTSVPQYMTLNVYVKASLC